MLKNPLKKIFITQEFGVNPEVYSRFGYKGHNGIDYRLFNKEGNRAQTAEVFAPHAGKVLEAANDKDGYGWYLKVENQIEGSVLGHLKSFNVKVGDTVTQGQFIAIANNSGFSSGAHLHWGYYKKPRNRRNGYGGFIDQSSLISQNEDVPNWMTQLLSLELKLDPSISEGDFRARVGEIAQKLKTYDELSKRISELEKKVAFEAGQAASFETELSTSIESRERLTKEVAELKEQVTRRDVEINRLGQEVQRLNEAIDPETTVLISKEEYQRLNERRVLDRYTRLELFRELVRRLLRR